MDLNNFKSQYRYGGFRTSQFRVTLTNPIDSSADLKMPFLCKAASLPTSTLNMLEAFHFGRSIKVAGKRTFEDWAVTVYEDEDFVIRNSMESWMNAINSPETNRRGTGTSDINAYKSTAVVDLLSQTNAVLRTYKFVGIFPTNIASIEMGWDSENLGEYSINFACDYFIVEPGNTGDAGGV